MSIPRFVEVAGASRERFPRAKYFYFTDEDFFARPVDDLKEFAELYPAKVGLPFECMAPPQQITEKKCRSFLKRGCCVWIQEWKAKAIVLKRRSLIGRYSIRPS